MRGWITAAILVWSSCAFGQPGKTRVPPPPGKTIANPSGGPATQAPNRAKATPPPIPRVGRVKANQTRPPKPNAALKTQPNQPGQTGVKPDPQGTQEPAKKVAKGKPPVTKMTCEPNPVRIGEPLVCTATIIHRSDVSVALSGPTDAQILPGDAGVPHGAGRTKTVRKLVITPKSMRKTFVKDVAVIWREQDGAEGQAPLPIQRVPTASVMTDVTNPSFRTFAQPQGERNAFWTAHGPVPHRVVNWTAIIICVSVLVVLIGVSLGFFIRRWLDSRRVEEPEYIDPRPAHIIAFEAFDRLAAENLPSLGKIDEYYVRVSEILRGYLESRFKINGLEMTSDEIRSWSRETDFPDEVRRGIDEFLADSDLVKFADFQPSMAAVETIARRARGLVSLTQENRTETAPNPGSIQQDKNSEPPQGTPGRDWIPEVGAPSTTIAPIPGSDDEEGPA